ncbi:MAG: GDP-mannose 4,6-dehydratase [Sporolactobacillus sp.]|jgi:GDP-4-dehydro-6-deoxy-D-mannose reductase|nr:GDP-mannose 4,6-dehydratase [Sporolactobacillus sp.]
MKVLVTGANGFVARHLAKKLMELKRYQISLTTYHAICESALGKMIKMDVTDLPETIKVIRTIKPDVIIHLAAQSNIPSSWKDPVATMSINTIGTTNIILAIVKLHLAPKLIFVGSGEEYGLTAKSRPLLTETDPCQPQNPYAISKLAAEQLSVQLARKNHLNLIFLRPFNHFGPGQKTGFVVSDFCSQIAKIEDRQMPPTMKVGNIRTARDFLAVSDVVHAYELAIEKDLPTGIYNISSGKAVLIESILHYLLKLTETTVRLQMDEIRFRTEEIKSFAGDSSKFRQSAGWKPVCDLSDCLKATLNWWRAEIKHTLRDNSPYRQTIH